MPDNDEMTAEILDAEAVLSHANTLCSEGKHADALPLFYQAIQGSPLNTVARRQLGQVLSHLGRREEAITAYRQLLEIVPGNAEALLSIAVHLSAIGKHHEAIASINHLLDGEPQHLQALLTKGQIQAHIGEREAAAATFEAVTSVFPDSELAWYSYAQVVSDPHKSVAVYRRLSALHVKNIDYWRALGEAVLAERLADDPEALDDVTALPGIGASTIAGSRTSAIPPPSRGTADERRGRLEYLAELVSRQHRRLGFLDSLLRATHYGQSTLYLRAMALYAEKFGAQPAYPAAESDMPGQLVAAFTMDGRVPVESGYFNGRYPEAFVDTVTDRDLDGHIAVLPETHFWRGLARTLGRLWPFSAARAKTAPLGKQDMRDWMHRAYLPHDASIDKQLMEELRRHRNSSQDIAVYDARGAFYESLCIWAGTKPTAIRRRKVACLASRLTSLTVAEWERNPTRYDRVVAMNVPQQGLGAFGDALDPDADLAAMRRLRAMVKPGGRLFVALIVGADRIHWNVSRVYGAVRLPLVLEGWKLVRPSHIGAGLLESAAPRRILLVLENVR